MEDVSGLTPLINIGAIGCILAWFLVKLEPRFRAMEDAIDRNTKASLVHIMASSNSPGVKTVAQELLKEIEDKRNNPK